MTSEIDNAVPHDIRNDTDGWLIQVEASQAWFRRRVLPLSIEQLRWRPEAAHWSIAECLDHLNLTLELYLPKIDDAIARGGPHSSLAECARCGRAELDALRLFEPPVSVSAAAPSCTLPAAVIDVDRLVEHFHRVRDRYSVAVRRAIGLDLRHIVVIEPVYPMIVTLGGTFALIAAHDRRHMWQAERVRQSPRFPRAAFAQY